MLISTCGLPVLQPLKMIKILSLIKIKNQRFHSASCLNLLYKNLDEKITE